MITEFSLCNLQSLVIWDNALSSYDKLMQLPIGTLIEVGEQEYTIIQKGVRPSDGDPVRGEQDVNALLDGQIVQVYIDSYIRAQQKNLGLCARKGLTLRSVLESAYTKGSLTTESIYLQLNALAARGSKHRLLENRLKLVEKIRGKSGNKNGNGNSGNPNKPLKK